MTGLDPITVADAGPVMASAIGLRWPDDRPEVVKYINRYRLLLYTLYNDFKLFDDTFHCICVGEFPHLCTDYACDTYQGITLPEDILSVEGIWSYGLPLLIRSRWRESHVGVNKYGPRVEGVEMAERFCTERDLKVVTKIKMFADREEDNGKIVYLDVIAKSGRQQRLAMTLIYDGWAVSAVPVRKILSISLPAGRLGSVRLSQNDGYDLSIYAPWENVPNYRRMRLPSTCARGTVLVQGVKRYRDVYFDHDIVEVGNALVIESAGRYFKYGEATTEAAEVNRAKYDLSEMGQRLNGLIARHRGHAIQDASPFKGTYKKKNNTLPGYA